VESWRFIHGQRELSAQELDALPPTSTVQVIKQTVAELVTYVPCQWFEEDPGLVLEDPRQALVRFSLLLEAKDRHYALFVYNPDKFGSGPDLDQPLPSLWDFHESIRSHYAFHDKPAPTPATADQEALMAICIEAADNLEEWLKETCVRGTGRRAREIRGFWNCRLQECAPHLIGDNFVPPLQFAVSPVEMASWRKHLWHQKHEAVRGRGQSIEIVHRLDQL
jgi:hypothetical protein